MSLDGTFLKGRTKFFKECYPMTKRFVLGQCFCLAEQKVILV